jgi:hypothetical protein
MPYRVLIVGLVLVASVLLALAGPVEATEASTSGAVSSGAVSRWSRFDSTSVRTTSQVDHAAAAATDTLAVSTVDVVAEDYAVVSEEDAVVSEDYTSAPVATRLFRSGASPSEHVGHHEPPPNYNFRDPNYYPDAGLGFPIRSSHGTWIGGRRGVRSWNHRGYHENYHQGTIQWRW